MTQCKFCNNPVPKGRRRYCSDKCAEQRNYNPEHLKMGHKQAYCKTCQSKFTVEHPGQLYCDAHRPPKRVRVKEGKGRPLGGKNSRKYRRRRSSKVEYTYEERELLIRMILRQYGRKPAEWRENQ